MIRKVLLTEDQLLKINEDKNRWASRGLETGGYLFGHLYPNGLAEVTHVLDGGPKAERTPMSFSGDNEYATEVKTKLQKEDPEIALLGEYHLHPWDGYPIPSAGDVEQLKKAKEVRPWFFILLNTKSSFKFWDLKNESDVTEVRYQIVKAGMSRERLLERILKTVRSEELISKTILMAGLGSGGSVIAKYLGCTGIGRMILVDNEDLEVENLIRHEGGIDDLKRAKTEICKRIIESHNPFVVVEGYNLNVEKNVDKLEELAMQSDLIIGSSGSPRVNRILNRISVKHRIPALYGGVYEKGLGGYILAVKPFETACFSCLFDLTSKSYSVDREVARRYGLDEEELHRQQGLWIDISFPALILAKLALAILQGEKLDYNLVLWSSDLEIKKLTVKRREDCSVCNEEGWRRRLVKGKLSFWQRLRRLFEWKQRIYSKN